MIDPHWGDGIHLKWLQYSNFGLQEAAPSLKSFLLLPKDGIESGMDRFGLMIAGPPFLQELSGPFRILDYKRAAIYGRLTACARNQMGRRVNIQYVFDAEVHIGEDQVRIQPHHVFKVSTKSSIHIQRIQQNFNLK